MSDENLGNEVWADPQEKKYGRQDKFLFYLINDMDIPRPTSTFHLSRGQEYVVYTAARHLRRMPRTEDKNYLMPDFSVKIPEDIVEKLNWKVGTELVVNVLDESTSEAVIGKRFHGEEAKQKFRALREGLYDDSDE